jgi:hypothetical protein
MPSSAAVKSSGQQQMGAAVLRDPLSVMFCSGAFVDHATTRVPLESCTATFSFSLT